MAIYAMFYVASTYKVHKNVVDVVADCDNDDARALAMRCEIFICFLLFSLCDEFLNL